MDVITLLAAHRDHLIGIGPLILGILIVAALILAVVFGMRAGKTRSLPPRQKPPAGPHPGFEEDDHVHPAEMPHDGRRRMPYEISTQPDTAEEDEPEPGNGPARRDENGPDSTATGRPGA
ncbi:DUF6479 family protein [Streptomyces sp. HNM0574]|uniref:DUF6479 family protein n=1 Tax=Streptomyces sp. HNM0574 TaxID=2714954 RepID=UPI00146A98CD|nr:DUF6479 family protein [Streptomyces sp. HNM0574]NLU68686.1 hypothetical protein [Streptomyces sp. HNM0574]